MNILYIAYSCSPDHGSEDRIGWKIPWECSKKHKVFVITKEEHRDKIEKYLNCHNNTNIEFFYADIPGFYKRIYKGFLYSGRLNIWHSRALSLAEEICRDNKIDLIHQITPVEFRSIGDYGRISDVKFVCGPVGGGEYIPDGLKYYARKHRFEEWLRKIANRRGRKSLIKRGLLKNCDMILYANEETKQYLSQSKSKSFKRCISETGIDEVEISEVNCKTEGKCIFLVAGRLVYRKGIEFLLEALSRVPKTFEYECNIVGNGAELKRLRKKCKKEDLENRVFFKGRIPFDQMQKLYQTADVLILPSLRETTGSVILEAMSNGLSVVTVNSFGGAVLLDESTGYLYKGNDRNSYIDGLSEAIQNCICNSDELHMKKCKAKEVCLKNTWERKVEFYNSIYEKVIFK